MTSSTPKILTEKCKKHSRCSKHKSVKLESIVIPPWMFVKNPEESGYSRSKVRWVSYRRTCRTTPGVNINGPTQSTTCAPTRTCRTSLRLFRMFFSVGITPWCSVRVTSSDGFISFSRSSRKRNGHYEEYSDITMTIKRTFVYDEHKPLNLVCANANFLQNPSMLRRGHFSMVEHDIHL